MQSTTLDWAEFRETWARPRNVRIAAGMTPFDWSAPALETVIDELRRDEDVVLRPGTRGDRLHLKPLNMDAFRALPMETVMERPFGLAHFDLARFDAPGQFLHGFGARVLQPWRDALSAAGFTCDRCYPIVFISGRGCTTNYHMDLSHVLAWQIYGTKRFCGLRDPDRWADRDARLAYDPETFARPEGVGEPDALCYQMAPGDRLWNVLLTPHWVEAGDEVAMSFNISHGGLRLRGALSRNEAELESFRSSDPERAPARVERVYRPCTMLGSPDIS